MPNDGKIPKKKNLVIPKFLLSCYTRNIVIKNRTKVTKMLANAISEIHLQRFSASTAAFNT
jgi:hypothetical protein